MTEQDMAQIRDMIEAMKSHNDDECLVNPAHCRVRWRRRMVVMVLVVLAMCMLGEIIHLEALVKGWEFLGAAVVDKLIFGVAE